MSFDMVASHVRLTEDGGGGKINKPWFRLMEKLTKLLGALQVKRVTPDFSITTNTTLGPVTSSDGSGVAFDIAVNEEWIATFTLDVGAGLSTTGIKIAIVSPAGSTLNAIVGITPDTVTATDTLSGRTTTSGSAIVFTAASLGGVSNALVIVNVWVQNATTPGSVLFEFAQNTSSATPLIIRAGSQMVANRLQ